MTKPRIARRRPGSRATRGGGAHRALDAEGNPLLRCECWCGKHELWVPGALVAQCKTLPCGGKGCGVEPIEPAT